MDSECLEDSEYFDNSGVLWIFPFPLRILSEALCSHSVRFTLALDLTEILSQPILQKFGKNLHISHGLPGWAYVFMQRKKSKREKAEERSIFREGVKYKVIGFNLNMYIFLYFNDNWNLNIIKLPFGSQHAGHGIIPPPPTISWL